MAVEKLTRERRRQQTRDVLVAAAAEVFARRGYEGASLEEIAETAGFTRGAIYKNFSGKEDLFLAVTARLNDQIIEAFRAIAPTGGSKEWDFSRLADLWRASIQGWDEMYALGLEFQLYMIRNPDARARSAAQHREQRGMIAAFIDEVAERSEMTLRLPSETLAGVVLAAADGLSYAARVHDEDLFEPFLQILNHGMVVESTE